MRLRPRARNKEEGIGLTPNLQKRVCTAEIETPRAEGRQTLARVLFCVANNFPANKVDGGAPGLLSSHTSPFGEEPLWVTYAILIKYA